MKTNFLIVFFLSAVLLIAFFSYYDMSEYLDTEEFTFTRLETNNKYTLYRYYKELERPKTKDYVAYVLEESDDEYLSENYPNASIQDVISILREITYEPEEGEYPKYPIETIVDGTGDCEDLAILGASILYESGYNCSLAVSDKHMFIIADGNSFDSSGHISSNYEKIYHVSDRPVLYHEWKYVSEEVFPFIRYVKGEILIYNYGNTKAEVTLEIAGKRTRREVNPFSDTHIDFRTRTEEDILVTRLYYRGVMINEHYEINS